MHDRRVGRLLQDLVRQLESSLDIAGLERVSRGREDLLGALGDRRLRRRARHVDRLRVIVDHAGLGWLCGNHRRVVRICVATVKRSCSRTEPSPQPAKLLTPQVGR